MICPHCKKEIEMPETETETKDDNEVEGSIEGSPESIRATLETLIPKEK